MITVVNKYKHTPTSNDVYIGRPSPLGNMFSWLPKTPPSYKVKDRASAIEAYEDNFLTLLHDAQSSEILNKLVESEMNGENINLICYCKPQACHGDIIKKVVEERALECKKHSANRGET